MERATRNKELVRRFVDAANARDYEALEEVVSAGFERHCPATPDVDVRSFEELRGFLERDCESFPDNRVQLQTLVAEGDMVAVWARYGGTQAGPVGPFPPTGKRMECEFAGIFTIEDGAITSVRLTWDNVGVLTQLGHLPAVG
jgi:steroid delta-isomerase-like uncharacterized protein